MHVEKAVPVEPRYRLNLSLREAVSLYVLYHRAYSGDGAARVEFADGMRVLRSEFPPSIQDALKVVLTDCTGYTTKIVDRVFAHARGMSDVYIGS